MYIRPVFKRKYTLCSSHQPIFLSSDISTFSRPWAYKTPPKPAASSSKSSRYDRVDDKIDGAVHHVEKSRHVRQKGVSLEIDRVVGHVDHNGEQTKAECDGNNGDQHLEFIHGS